MRPFLMYCIVLGWWVSTAQGQSDSLPAIPASLAAYWETVAEVAARSERQIGEWNTFYEQLELLLHDPLPLNRATREELSALPLLDEHQIESFLYYRQRYGNLVSLYELQAVPGWDLATIRAILPFVRLSANNWPKGSAALRFGQSKLYMRTEWRTSWQEPYLPKAYLRYKFAAGRRLQWGLTVEKDSGEAWWSAQSPYGVDFLSAHLQINRPFGKWRRLLLGDYHLRLGQGLLVWTGFAPAFGPHAMDIARANMPLRPYTSSQENGFMRGAAAAWQPSALWNVWLFASQVGRDATVCCLPDSLVSFSALRTSGLHVSATAQALRGILGERLLGTRVQRELPKGFLAINLLQWHYSLPRQPQPRLDNAFTPMGALSWMGSFDYNYIWRNVLLFGEWAWQAPVAFAATTGAIWTAGSTLRLAWQARAFSKAFYSQYAQPVSNWSYAHNEQGMYWGVEWRPNKQWILNAWYDWFRSPWLRFGQRAPVSGHAFRMRLSWSPWRHVEWYVEWRGDSESKTKTSEQAPIARDAWAQRQLWTVQIVVPFSEGWTWRSRLSLSRYSQGIAVQRGYLWYHDVLYRPVGKSLSFTARMAVFHTQGYESRIYAYENDLLYNLSLPAFYNAGTRIYCNIRWKATRRLTVEGRIAHSRRSLRLFSTQGDYSSAPSEWQIKSQLRWQF